MGTADVLDETRFPGGVERFNGVHTALLDHSGEATVVFAASIRRHGNTGMEFPRFELVAAQVSDGLEASIQGRLCSGLAHFVPGCSGMKHLNGGVPCFLGSLDLFRVLVAVADFQGQGVITNVTFDVYTKICLLYTSPSPRDKRQSRMPSSA